MVDIAKAFEQLEIEEPSKKETKEDASTETVDIADAFAAIEVDEEKDVAIDDTASDVIGIAEAFANIEVEEEEAPDMTEGFKGAEEIGTAPRGFELIGERIGVQLGHFTRSEDKKITGFQLGRKPALLAEAMGGDVPFIGEYVKSYDPFTDEQLVPESRAEELLYVGGRLGRDLYLFSKIRGAITGVAKMDKIAKAGKWVKNIPKVGDMLADEIIPLALQGGAWKAITAGTSEPKEIAKEAAKTAMFFAALPIAFKGIQKLGTPIVKEGAKFLKKFFERPILAFNKSNIKKLIFDNVTGTNEALLERAAFTRKLKMSLTPEERELMPFVIQKTNVPVALGRKDLELLSRDPKVMRKLNKYVKVIEKQFDAAHKFFIESGGKMGKLEKYVTQLWEVTPQNKNQIMNFFRTNTAYSKSRFYKSYLEGINAGLTPKTLDIANILSFYDTQVIKASFNLRFVRALSGIKAADGRKLIQDATRPGKEKGSFLYRKAPEGYVKFNHPALEDKWVHSEIKPFLDVMLGEVSTPSQIARAYDGLNALLKSSQLALSLFHPTALTESALVFPGVGPKEVLSVWNPLNIIKAAKSGRHGVWKDLEGSKIAIRSGLGVHAPSDVQKARVDKMLESFASTVGKKLGKTVGKAARLPLWLKQKQDWFLWEYLHPTLKLTAFHNGSALALAKNPNMPAGLVRREVAQFVNDTFGGQHMELLGISKTFAKHMQRMMLSPDWNISTIRQAMSVFGTGTVNSVTGGVRKQLAEEFWKNALVYFYAGSNLLNYRMSESVTGKGRYMWGNPPGKKTMVYWGQAGVGPEKYIRPGKQFRELPEFLNPKTGGKKVISKAAPLAMATFSAVTVMTDPNLTYGEKNLELLKEISSQFIPFAISGLQRSDSPAGLMVGVSDGMTPYSTTKFLERALKTSDTTGIEEIKRAAHINNIDFNTAWSRAKSNVVSDYKYPYKQRAKAIAEEFFRLTGKEASDFLVNLEKSGTLLPIVEEELKKILKDKVSALAQRQKAGL